MEMICEDINTSPINTLYVQLDTIHLFKHNILTRC